MEMTSDYCKNFNPEWFLETYHVHVDENTTTGMVRNFTLKSFHRYFTSGVDFGNYLWDVGSGPTIWSILSASRRMKHIILSDYAPRNLQILRDWRDGKRSEPSSLIQREMELAGEKQLINDREAHIRSKVTGIHHIDVTKESVFIDPNLDGMVFDVITSCFCLEAASKDKEEYGRSVKNISKMLKSGGYLIVLGAVEETYYKIDKFQFHVLSLKTEEIRSIYKENGFEILDMDTLFQEGHIPDVQQNTLSDIKNMFALFAKKLPC